MNVQGPLSFKSFTSTRTPVFSTFTGTPSGRFMEMTIRVGSTTSTSLPPFTRCSAAGWPISYVSTTMPRSFITAAAACIFSLMVSMKEASPPGKEATSCFFMGGYIFSIIHIMSPVFTAPESSRAARTALSPYSPAWTAHTAATIMPANKLLIMDGV